MEQVQRCVDVSMMQQLKVQKDRLKQNIDLQLQTRDP